MARSTARRLADLEAGVWRSLAVWITRRRPGRQPGDEPFAYHRQVQPVLLAFLAVGLLELPVAHLLVPWHPVKWTLLVIGVWGVLWTLGYMAGRRVFPHLVGREGITVRSGPRISVHVPWPSVASVRQTRGRVPTNADVHAQDGVAQFAMMKMTRVRIELVSDVVLSLPDGPITVSAIELYADDSKGFVAAARRRLAEHGVRRDAAPVPAIGTEPAMPTSQSFTASGRPAAS